MIKPLSLAIIFAVGLTLGAGVIRLTDTQTALAQSASATPYESTPMHTMGTGNCDMNAMMMKKAKTSADKALMQSMMQMHEGMMHMTLNGDADHDFMVMMIPHHQSAVAMANVELQYGHNPKLLAMARAIIASQNREIAEMKSLLGQ